MNWPRKIFLESTALFPLGPRFEKLELSELLRYRDGLHFEVIVADVSWHEYVRRREKEIQECLTRIRQCKSTLAKHGQPVGELEQAAQKGDAYLLQLPGHFLGMAKNLGITILQVPPVDLQLLLRMSLDNAPPFEDSQSDAGEKSKEKGFRDALIMFTVLENIRNRPDDNALIVTHDDRLTEGFRRLLPEYKTSLEIVDSLEKARAHVDSRLDSWYREKLRKEAEEAKHTLLKYREQISDCVLQVRELTENDLGQGVLARVLGSKSEEQFNVQELRSLTFDTVESALWENKDEPISRILFKIRCLAHVTGQPPSAFVLWDPPTFTVGGGKQSHISVSASDGTVEKDLPVHLYGEAQLEKTGDDWRLISLKVDKSLPSEEDWRQLVRVSTLLGE